MADRLTQLQDALDQLATQFYASLRYISAHHAPPLDANTSASSPGAQTLSPSTAANDASQQHQQQQPPVPRPDSPNTFAARQRELARDLITKETQIEILIARLPGVARSEQEQADRLRGLEAELRAAEAERLRALAEREEVLGRLDRVIAGVRRV
ncbi:MAG: RNA polymerase II mediator complex subunit [Thelocarpon impressellum]|nr:MAG: RNA polymerase II mediator complex subunit [Thelocarpon impressellum]